MKDDLIKYAMLAAAGYLAYSYLKSSGLWDQWFGGAPAVAAAGTNPATGTGVPFTEHVPPAATTIGASAATAAQQAANTAASASTAATVDDSKLMVAAYDPAQAAVSGNAVLNWDQWNWYSDKYATQNGLAKRTTYGPEDVGITDRTMVITAAQYHAMKAAKGLSGLAAASQMLPYKTWGRSIN